MEAHEILEKIRNKKADYKEVFQWCEENIDSIDFGNKEHQNLYDTAIRYMMKSKINSLSEKEAAVMVKYLAQSYIHEKGLNDRIKISVLDREQFIQKHKSDKFNAMCTTFKDSRFELDYSPNVIANIRSGDINRFLDGLKTVYHETAHVIQESSIRLSEINGEKVHYNASMYQIALENVARVADPNFYTANYDNLVLENQANKVGLLKGYLAIKKYAPQHLNRYSADKIMAQANKYDEQSQGDIMVFGERKDRITYLDTLCNVYIGQKQHIEMLQKYPILQLAYHPDGSKKDIITLLKDRAQQLENGEDVTVIDELYRSIANKKDFFVHKGIKAEILDLGKYIQETGTDDEFVYGLLRDRLQMKNLTPEKIESLVEMQRKAAEVRRKQLTNKQSKGEPEIPLEEKESIRDEVGDEIKPKTEGQKQDEKQAEATWMNRLQTNNDNVAKMQDGAKKQQDVVKLIQDLDREHRQDRNQQIQEENQNNGQGR